MRMRPLALSRRALIGGALTAGLLPRVTMAAPARSDLKFIFVRNFGGWDPTRVFATELDNAAIAYEEGVEIAQVGGLSFVDHRDRPTVRDFFTAWADRSLILNGVIVPSVNHRICERLACTGSNLETAPDVPTMLADARAADFGLPHVVIGGRSHPGNLGRSLIRIGEDGQVGKLLDGSILAASDAPARAPDAAVAALLDTFARDGAALRTTRSPGGRDARAAAAVRASLGKAETMKELRDSVRWNTDGTFSSQIDLATDLLSLGLSRCATLSFERDTWDSHESNEEKQADNFLDLFEGLITLMTALEATPGPLGGTLAEETVVVVTSEMGRTPYINDVKGKDHWAHTSALLVGPGLTGGRVVGGFTDLFYGDTVDLATGELSAGGREITPSILCSTLLALGDVGSAPSLREFAPILGILA